MRRLAAALLAAALVPLAMPAAAGSATCNLTQTGDGNTAVCEITTQVDPEAVARHLYDLLKADEAEAQALDAALFADDAEEEFLDRSGPVTANVCIGPTLRRMLAIEEGIPVGADCQVNAEEAGLADLI